MGMHFLDGEEVVCPHLERRVVGDREGGEGVEEGVARGEGGSEEPRFVERRQNSRPRVARQRECERAKSEQCRERDPPL